RPLVDANRHQLTVALPDRPLHVVADPTRLEQVVANLLNNAAKYTDPGGRIDLGVRADGGEVELRVADNGVGIPADMLERIFEPFTQVERSLDRAQGGLGIGLTLVQRLVAMQGGRVEVRSEGPGRGSEFVVRLPLAAPAEANGHKPAAPAAGPAPRRVLVVDDNVDAAQTMGVLLEAAGHDVRLAHDGPGALEAARDYGPDVVLLDIGLPGMNGFEVAAGLRAAFPRDGLLLV